MLEPLYQGQSSWLFYLMDVVSFSSYTYQGHSSWLFYLMDVVIFSSYTYPPANHSLLIELLYLRLLSSCTSLVLLPPPPKENKKPFLLFSSY